MGALAGTAAATGFEAFSGALTGGAGTLAIEAAIATLTLRHGVIPPTMNLEEPDPECDLNVVSGAARRQSVRTLLSNSFGFGGINASLVFVAYGQ